MVEIKANVHPVEFIECVVSYQLKHGYVFAKSQFSYLPYDVMLAKFGLLLDTAVF
jgi:hypothetical protein